MARSANSSSGEQEFSSDSESEPHIKPSPSKKPRSNNPALINQSTGKRPAAEGEASDPKRIKETVDVDNGGEKKPLFQRLWSEENEVELIQGMISYVEEKGKDPLADVNDFHQFVRETLHVDVNDRQVLTKARRLKKKFKNNVAKVENNGKVRSFSNPHEKKMYELSKNLWGSDGKQNLGMSPSINKVKVKVNVTPNTNKGHTEVGTSNGNVGIEVTPSEVESKAVQPLGSSHGLDHLGSMGLPITEEVIVNKGFELLSGPKKVEMEEKWKNIKVQELELFLKKVDILKEQAKVVLNAVVNSGGK